MPNDWNPTLRCADAIAEGQFAVVYGELEYDDPFSIMLFYDGSFEQPWRRVDVQREINAVTAFNPDTGDGTIGRYALLSNEGDVYFSDDDFANEKITGAGVLSPDASGRGAMYALAAYQSTLFAAGEGNQVYRREPIGSWNEVASDAANAPAGGTVAFAALHAFDADRLLAVGGVLPEAEAYDVTQDPGYSDDMSTEELMSLFERQASGPEGGMAPVGKAVLLASRMPRELALPSIPDLRAIHVQSPEEIWIVGSGGTILQGSLSGGFRKVSFHGDTQTLLSITRFRGDIIVASDYALHRFDGHHLTPLKPMIDPLQGAGVPTPMKVQAVGDLMFYFDYKHGVHLYDGNAWRRIAIPPEFLQREFSGLQR